MLRFKGGAFGDGKLAIAGNNSSTEQQTTA
jgi:hypothetical protein